MEPGFHDDDASGLHHGCMTTRLRTAHTTSSVKALIYGALQLPNNPSS